MYNILTETRYLEDACRCDACSKDKFPSHNVYTSESVLYIIHIKLIAISQNNIQCI